MEKFSIISSSARTASAFSLYSVRMEMDGSDTGMGIL